VPDATIDVDALRTHCRARLAGFKVPRSIDVVAAVPRNASGKVRKHELRAPFWPAGGRGIA
jgi:long-chain acyl-CoA synthetase